MDVKVKVFDGSFKEVIIELAKDKGVHFQGLYWNLIICNDCLFLNGAVEAMERLTGNQSNLERIKVVPFSSISWIGIKDDFLYIHLNKNDDCI